MQIVSQLYGDGGDGEIEEEIVLRPKALARPLTRLTDRRSAALTVQAQCLFFSAVKIRLTCAHKVVTRRAGRSSWGYLILRRIN